MLHALKKTTLAALVAAVGTTATLATTPAAAEPANYAGYEIRGNLPGQESFRDNHLWRFTSGGRVNGIYTTLSTDVRGGEYVSESDVGRWRKHIYQGVCGAIETDLDLDIDVIKTPWKDLPDAAKNLLSNGRSG